MKKILVGSMIALAIGTNDPILANSNLNIETEKGKDAIASVLKTTKVFSNQLKIQNFEKEFRDWILMEYSENSLYFWEYFGYVSNPNNNWEEFISDCLDFDNKKYDKYDTFDLLLKLKERFGDNAYKDYYKFLFLVSLEETWNMREVLFQENDRNTYFDLTGDLLAYFLEVWFEFYDDVRCMDKFTFRKQNDGTIEIISLFSTKSKVIGRLSSQTIATINKNTYSMIDFLFEESKLIKN